MACIAAEISQRQPRLLGPSALAYGAFEGDLKEALGARHGTSLDHVDALTADMSGRDREAGA